MSLITAIAESQRGARFALYGTFAACSLTSISFLAADWARLRAFHNSAQVEYQQAIRLQQELSKAASCSTRNIRDGRYYTLITSAWNHRSIYHFVVNMVGLINFGRAFVNGILPRLVIDDVLSEAVRTSGHVRGLRHVTLPGFFSGASEFLMLFYGGAIAGNILCLTLSKRKKEHTAYVGASGGLCALSTAVACLFPRLKMYARIGCIWLPGIPAIWATMGFVVYSAWAETSGFEKGVAHIGHLGGVLYGFLWFGVRFYTSPKL